MLPAGTPASPVRCTGLTEDCFYPYPSNVFTRASASPTGLHLNLNAVNFPTPISQQVLEVYRPEALNSSDGFSPIAPILTSLPEMPDPTSLPGIEASVAPDASVRVVDMATGMAAPLRAVLDPVAAEQGRALLSIRQAAPLATGHTYLMVVTDRVRTLDGAPMPAFEGFRAFIEGRGFEGSDDATLRAAHAPMLDALIQVGEVPERVVVATLFTVRSDANLTARTLAVRRAVLERARRKPPRYEIIESHAAIPAIEQGVARVIVLSYTVPEYRGADGRIVFDAEGRPVEQYEAWRELQLELPENGSEPAPVVIFGHGLSVVKETMLQVTGELARRGIATAGIDVGGHGSRVGEDGPITSYFRWDRILDVADLFLQTIADQMQLARLIQGPLSDLDVLPAPHGDGLPDLAPAPIFFIGQSLGTVLGGTFVAIEPAISAAVLNVPGGGFVNLLQESDGLGGLFESFVPHGSSPDERAILASLAQSLVDPIDPVNFARHLDREPFFGDSPRDVLLQESIEDGIVPNLTTEALARALGAPQVLPAIKNVFRLPPAAPPLKGSGLTQFEINIDSGIIRHGFLLQSPAARHQVGHYLETRWREGRAEIIQP